MAPMTPPQMAAAGRNGDSVVAHLTPGEIQVPPQVQTPHLLNAIRAAFAHFGIGPQQFTAGSPQQSHNPATGAPEFNLLSAILPVAGAIGGSFIPGIGTVAGMGLGGALGGAAGGAMDGGGAQHILASAIGGGAGGALGGALMPAAGAASGAAGAAGAAGGAAGAAPAAGAGSVTTEAGLGVGAGAANPFAGGASSSASSLANPELGGSTGFTQAAGHLAGSPSFGSQIASLPWKAAAGAGIGSTVGGMMAPPTQGSALPPGFNTPMSPLNTQFGQLNGSGTTNAPTFQGYNPYAAATGSQPYTFYPKQ